MYTGCSIVPIFFRLFKTDISMASPLLVAFTYYQGSSDASLPAQGYKYFIQLHTSGSPSRVFLDPIATTITEGNNVISESDPCGCKLIVCVQSVSLCHCVTDTFKEWH